MPSSAMECKHSISKSLCMLVLEYWLEVDCIRFRELETKEN